MLMIYYLNQYMDIMCIKDHLCYILHWTNDISREFICDKKKEAFNYIFTIPNIEGISQELNLQILDLILFKAAYLSRASRLIKSLLTLLKKKVIKNLDSSNQRVFHWSETIIRSGIQIALILTYSSFYCFSKNLSKLYLTSTLTNR